MASEVTRPRPPRPAQQPTGGNRVNEQAGEQLAAKIKSLHDEAYLYIEQGLTCDEQGRFEQAVTLYTKGLRCIDQAMTLSHGSAAEHQEHVHQMIQKMERSKAKIQARVENLINTDASVAYALDDPPPSYEVATTPTNSDFDMLLAESLTSDQVMAGGVPTEASASELFSIADGVQIYFITPEGYVSAPSYPSSLGIYKFSERMPRGNAPAFLKVGEWTYPLVPGCSPVLRADWGSYVFPDTDGPPGSAVGVIIPDAVTAAQRAKFERTLDSFTAMRQQPIGGQAAQPPPAAPHTAATTAPPRPERPPSAIRAPEQKPATLAAAPKPTEEEIEDRTSQKISKGLVVAAEWISWGLTKGAEKTGELLKKGSGKLQESLKPEEEASKIDPNVQKGAHYARQATHAAVQVSGYLVQKLGQGTAALARYMAPHLRKGGESLLPKSWTESTNGASKLDDVAEVASGGIKGWATVYVGLEQAARLLAKSIADETVSIVQHKYGADAGKLTENSLYSVTNVAVTANTVNNLGPKAVARRVAKDAGKAMVTVPKEDPKSAAVKEAETVTTGHCKAGTDGPSTSMHSEDGATIHCVA